MVCGLVVAQNCFRLAFCISIYRSSLCRFNVYKGLTRAICLLDRAPGAHCSGDGGIDLVCLQPLGKAASCCSTDTQPWCEVLGTRLGLTRTDLQVI